VALLYLFHGKRIMAESQETIEYDADLLAALEDALSTPRLAPYIGAARGDRKLAIRIYLWNSRLSKAFLFPLNIAEVTIRNAMDRALSSEFGGSNWILQPPFQLTPESEASRQRALLRLSGQPKPEDLVGGLTLDFWSNLFRREYKALWERPGLLATTFPYLPAGGNRGAVQLRVAKINQFRNRIAHHEPIHTLDHRTIYEEILNLVALRSPRARDWVRRCSTVMMVVRTPPSVDSWLPGLPLSSTNLRQPLILSEDMALLAALPAIGDARPPIALVPEHGVDAYRAVPASRIMSFIATQAVMLDGMLDLSAYTLSDVIAGTPSVPVVTIDRRASTGDVLAAFFPSGVPQSKRPQALLVISDKGVEGVILHPLIRYQ
jgi:hypothetical protein